jgi:Right handed beta helix region
MRTMVFLLAVLFVFVLAAPVAAATTWSGQYTTTQTMTSAGNPHNINGIVSFCGSSADLTVSAGAIVKFNSTGALVIGGISANCAGASLTASGTSANRVTFTSQQATPSPGDWNQIRIMANADAGEIHYADIMYGGSSTITPGMLTITNDEDMPIYHCNIHHSEHDGVTVSLGGSAAFTTTKVYDNAGVGIDVRAGSSAYMGYTTDIYDNTGIGILVRDESTVTMSGTRPAVLSHANAHGMKVDDAVVTATNSYFSGNIADGIQATNGADLTLVNTKISSNPSDGTLTSGVGMRITSGSTSVQMTAGDDDNALVFENYIGILIDDGADLTMEDYTVAENWVIGMYIMDGDVTLTTNIFEDNGDRNGGNVDCYPHLGLSDPVVAGIVIDNCDSCDFSGTDEFVGNKFYGNWYCPEWDDAADYSFGVVNLSNDEIDADFCGWDYVTRTALYIDDHFIYHLGDLAPLRASGADFGEVTFADFWVIP